MSIHSINDLIKIYNYDSISKYISVRPGEKKMGEGIGFVESLEALKTHPAKYVLLGIPEDIGVRANYGKPGTGAAWEASLSTFLNIQDNRFTNAEEIILLGEIDCEKQMAQAAEIDGNKDHDVEALGELVIQIDHKVEKIISVIVASGKIPIIIGGGHNNSYGNLAGSSKGIQKKMNCINFDAHTDFRSLEHRHSGNGFSYAFENGFLNRYFIFGLHQNYTSENVFCKLDKIKDRIRYNFFEDIKIEEKMSFSEAIKDAEDFCCGSDFGIELDLDAIEFMGSSAMTSSGFSMTDARKFLSHFSKNGNLRYVHICEGSPKAGVFPNAVAKGIAYLLTDVVRS